MAHGVGVELVFDFYELMERNIRLSVRHLGISVKLCRLTSGCELWSDMRDPRGRCAVHGFALVACMTRHYAGDTLVGISTDRLNLNRREQTCYSILSALALQVRPHKAVGMPYTKTLRVAYGLCDGILPTSRPGLILDAISHKQPGIGTAARRRSSQITRGCGHGGQSSIFCESRRSGGHVQEILLESRCVYDSVEKTFHILDMSRG
jgi:hypothetical protein